MRYAYFVTCRQVVKNAAGEVTELRCTYDPATRGGDAPDGRKVKGTLHWVSARDAVDAEVRLYGHLFARANPTDVPEGVDWKESLNADSLETLEGCKVEPFLAGHGPGFVCQFERLGYFVVDRQSSRQRPVFNRTVGLRDTWAKVQEK